MGREFFSLLEAAFKKLALSGEVEEEFAEIFELLGLIEGGEVNFERVEKFLLLPVEGKF